MVSHLIEVLSICWSGVVLGHGLAQGLDRDWVYGCAYGHSSGDGFSYKRGAHYMLEWGRFGSWFGSGFGS